MRYAFTLCSNNYLAQAKTLGDSLVKHNPDYRFIVGLVDRQSAEVDYAFLQAHRVIQVEEIGIEGFDELWQKYDIVELNTAVKPFFFSYLFREYPDAQSIVYLDPDIMVFAALGTIEQELEQSPIVIAPHVLSPLPRDSQTPQEKAFLQFGVYNLGFVAAANSSETYRFLHWWAERTYSECSRDLRSGVFVDQLWINLAPVFFEMKITRNPGTDVAYWNLHERQISSKHGAYLVNGEYPLLFYHFSAYNPLDPSTISPYQDRYSFVTRPDLVDLFALYRESLTANGYPRYSRLPCHFDIERRKFLEPLLWGEGNKDHVHVGFHAYDNGNIATARRRFVRAILQNPRLLANRGILSILIESVIGHGRMERYRQWKRRSTGTPHSLKSL